MAQVKPSKTRTAKQQASSEILSTILEELRLLRKEVALLFPKDSLEEYDHSDRIKRSYQNAVREYPPAS